MDAPARVAAPQCSDKQLHLKSWRYRRQILEIIKHAGAGHTGGSLSCVDILNVLYHRILDVSPQTFMASTRNRYVQSKGHCVEALYVVLADLGFFSFSDLSTMGQCGSHFIGHPTRKVPGVEQNTGALGHGLSISAGMALAAKLDGAEWRVFTLLGDGELAEGSNWEAAMAAGHYGLGNLTAIVDHNRLQITGLTRDVCSNEPLEQKFAAFGWRVVEANGHDIAELTRVLSERAEVPTLVIAHTIKGKGVSFMENSVKWHHGVPTADEYRRALAEIDAAILELNDAA